MLPPYRPVSRAVAVPGREGGFRSLYVPPGRAERGVVVSFTGVLSSRMVCMMGVPRPWGRGDPMGMYAGGGVAFCGGCIV